MTRTRGTGRVYQPTFLDPKTGGRRKTTTWAIRFYNRRTSKHEHLYGFKSEVAAERKLRAQLAGQDRGELVGPAVERTSFGDLAEMIVADYKANGRKVKRIEQTLVHLKRNFGDYRAVDISEDRISRYVASRREHGAAIATINRELAALRRMFNLARHRVPRAPRVPAYQENNTRQGFFEEPQLRAVQAHLPEDVAPIIEVAYITGWRVPSEILTRQWRHVDFEGQGWLRLEPGETKNREGRMFPMTPALRAALERQRERTTALEQAQDRIIPWVFHREGRRIRGYRRAWLSACVAAGLGTEVRNKDGKLLRKIAHRIPHDFRRTAIRNLERAGVPRSAAMKMVGHKTESVYRRYAIVDEAMLREAAEKLARLGSRLAP